MSRLINIKESVKDTLIFSKLSPRTRAIKRFSPSLTLQTAKNNTSDVDS
jgi:hypothetical protein